jgi:hypothetical protein
VTTGGAVETSVCSLSTNSGAGADGGTVSSQAFGFDLDLFAGSEDLGWGPWEVVLPAAQVPEGSCPFGAPFYGAFSAARQEYTRFIRVAKHLRPNRVHEHHFS